MPILNVLKSKNKHEIGKQRKNPSSAKSYCQKRSTKVTSPNKDSIEITDTKIRGSTDTVQQIILDKGEAGRVLQKDQHSTGRSSIR
jgi:hypothetical protein